MDSSAPTVVTLSTPADILGMLPYRLGFVPTESLVVICLEGPRQRDRLVMRLDLEADKHDKAFASGVAARTAMAGASAAIVVCYTTAEVPTGPPPAGEPLALPRRHLVDTLVDELRQRDIGVVEALVVSERRWWSYHCSNPACCPATGSDLPAELTAAAAHYAAEHVAEGGVVLASRDELVRSVRPPRNAVADAVRAQAGSRADARLLDAFLCGGIPAMRQLTISVLGDVVARWSAGDRDLDVDDAALLVAGLHDKQARDHAMTLLLDHDLRVLLELFGRLARAADDCDAAPVCTVMAWIAHAHGDGGLANIAVERALDCDEGYIMARLIDHGLEHMITPAQIRAVAREVRSDLRGETSEAELREVAAAVRALGPLPPSHGRPRRRRGKRR